MFQLSRWLSLYWFVLLPISSWLAAGFLFLNLRKQLQIKLESPRAIRWILFAFITIQLQVMFLLVNSFFETAIWPPTAALFSLLLLLVSHNFVTKLLRRESPYPYQEEGLTGLNNFGGKPRIDGIIHKCSNVLRLVLPFLPGLTIICFVLIQQVERWPGLWLIVIPYLSPILISTWNRKQSWIVISSMVTISIVFGFHAVQLSHTLPQGRWITPITSASCSSTVQLDLDRKFAWCADENTDLVYQFMPLSGFVGQGLLVTNSSQTFAGNNSRVLVMQNPLKGLVLLENGQQTQLKINLARQGTVDREGKLWVIDVTNTLWISQVDGDWKRLKASDGLLSNTANVVKTSPDGSVWVSSIGGINRLAQGTSEWQVILRSGTLPGIVKDFAFTPEGEVWYLWEAAAAYKNRIRWGVSIWKKFQWEHIELGNEIILDYPSSQHPIAIDGLGRVWFVAPSYIKKTNFLGILEPHSGVISLYKLGPFDVTPGEGFPIPGFTGVVDDGKGGIFLYNPAFEPLRHWSIDQESDEIYPCIEPCGIAFQRNSTKDYPIMASKESMDLYLDYQKD